MPYGAADLVDCFRALRATEKLISPPEKCSVSALSVSNWKFGRRGLLYVNGYQAG